MDEQAVVDAHALFQASGYSGTKEDFISLLSEDQNALRDSYSLFRSRGYNGSGEDYMALLGIEGAFAEAPEAQESTTTPTPDPPVSDWQAIEDANNMEHADWWSDHSDLGSGFGDWTFDGSYPGHYAQRWIKTDSDGTVQTVEKDEDGVTWRSNFLDNEAAEELGTQLELQQTQKNDSHENYDKTGKLTENSAEETDFQVKAVSFNRKNPDYNVFDFTLDPKGGMVANEEVTLTFTKNDGSIGEKVYSKGHVFDFTNDPFLQGETLEKLKEIYGILSVKKDADDKDFAERKASGEANVLQLDLEGGIAGLAGGISADLLDHSDHAIAEFLNSRMGAVGSGGRGGFLQFGFKAEDHETTWFGHGTVRVTSSDGEVFGFDYNGDGEIGDDERHVLADGGMMEYDGAIDAFNQWLKDNAVDYGSGVVANIEATGLTTDQHDKARKDAVSKTTNYFQNKSYLENKEEQDALKEEIMREAAASIRTSRFPNGYPSYEAYLEDVKDGFGGTSQSRKETVTAFNEWLYANLERFPDAAKYGFEIAYFDSDLYSRTGTQGWMINKLTENGWETVNLEKTGFHPQGLSTGYDAGTAFFEDHDLTDPANQVVDAAMERVWKSEFINNINKAIQDNNPEDVAQAERLGITAPELTYELSQEISNLSKEEIEDWENNL